MNQSFPEYEHPRFDVRVSVGLIFHHRCDIEYLNDYLSYFKPKFYGLIRKYSELLLCTQKTFLKLEVEQIKTFLMCYYSFIRTKVEKTIWPFNH